ncbi:hypothetical protein EDC01DRAFT_788413 [Geopyxis carbonaria]|nr:hypothetical protein EDC01DRAFT_788413 [Geopyxis carbonaria]
MTTNPPEALLAPALTLYGRLKRILVKIFKSTDSQVSLPPTVGELDAPRARNEEFETLKARYNLYDDQGKVIDRKLRLLLFKIRWLLVDNDLGGDYWNTMDRLEKERAELLRHVNSLWKSHRNGTDQDDLYAVQHQVVDQKWRLWLLKLRNLLVEHTRHSDRSDTMPDLEKQMNKMLTDLYNMSKYRIKSRPAGQRTPPRWPLCVIVIEVESKDEADRTSLHVIEGDTVRSLSVEIANASSRQARLTVVNDQGERELHVLQCQTMDLKLEVLLLQAKRVILEYEFRSQRWEMMKSREEKTAELLSDVDNLRNYLSNVNVHHDVHDVRVVQDGGIDQKLRILLLKTRQVLVESELRNCLWETMEDLEEETARLLRTVDSVCIYRNVYAEWQSQISKF